MTRTLVTRPIDFEGCDLVVAAQLKKGNAVACETENGYAFVQGYAKNKRYPYVGENDTFVRIIPVYEEPTITYVRRASELIAWLEDHDAEYKNKRWHLRYQGVLLSWGIGYLFQIAGKPLQCKTSLPQDWLIELKSEEK